MHGLLALTAVIVILPVVWIALGAFKTQIALLRGDVLFKPYFENFNELLFAKSADYFLHFGNSLLVASLTTLMVPIVGVLSAMALVGDRPSATDWCGFLLILSGAALIVLGPQLMFVASSGPRR